MNLACFSMASRRRSNPGVPSQQHKHCEIPSDVTTDATALWLNQLKYIWGLCMLPI